MRLVRITFVARLFGEMTTTVLPERVPGVIEKLWANDNVEIIKIELLLDGSETHA
jgi:hypothetical protein